MDVGSDKIKDIKDNANIISEDDLNQANEFRIKMDQMAERASLFGTKLMMQLMPILNDLFSWIEEHMPEIEAFTTKAFEFIGTAVIIAADIFNTYIIPALSELYKWINENVVPVLTMMYEWIQANMPTIQKVFKGVFDVIVEVVKVVWDVIENVLMPVLKGLWEFIGFAWPAIEAIGKVVFEAIKAHIDNVITVFGFLFDIVEAVYKFFTGDFSGAGAAIKNAFGGVTEFLGGIVDKFNAVKDAVSGAIKKNKGFYRYR